MACSDPPEAYEKLRIAYSRNTFSAEDTRFTISQALKANVAAFIDTPDVESILNHNTMDLALHVVHAKGLAASERKPLQGAALAGAFLMNAIAPSAMRTLYERVVFFSGPHAPRFTETPFRGRTVRLEVFNLREAALATGSLPYIVAGVPDIEGAPKGVYRDGGLLDYQLNQDYRPGQTASRSSSTIRRGSCRGGWTRCSSGVGPRPGRWTGCFKSGREPIS